MYDTEPSFDNLRPAQTYDHDSSRIPPPGFGLNSSTCGPVNCAKGPSCESSQLKYGPQIVADLHARRRVLERRRDEAQTNLQLVYELLKGFEG